MEIISHILTGVATYLTTDFLIFEHQCPGWLHQTHVSCDIETRMSLDSYTPFSCQYSCLYDQELDFDDDYLDFEAKGSSRGEMSKQRQIKTKRDKQHEKRHVRGLKVPKARVECSMTEKVFVADLGEIEGGYCGQMIIYAHLLLHANPVSFETILEAQRQLGIIESDGSAKDWLNFIEIKLLCSKFRIRPLCIYDSFPVISGSDTMTPNATTVMVIYGSAHHWHYVLPDYDHMFELVNILAADSFEVRVEDYRTEIFKYPRDRLNEELAALERGETIGFNFVHTAQLHLQKTNPQWNEYTPGQKCFAVLQLINDTGDPDWSVLDSDCMISIVRPVGGYELEPGQCEMIPDHTNFEFEPVPADLFVGPNELDDIKLGPLTLNPDLVRRGADDETDQKTAMLNTAIAKAQSTRSRQPKKKTDPSTSIADAMAAAAAASIAAHQADPSLHLKTGGKGKGKTAARPSRPVPIVPTCSSSSSPHVSTSATSLNDIVSAMSEAQFQSFMAGMSSMRKTTPDVITPSEEQTTAPDPPMRFNPPRLTHGEEYDSSEVLGWTNVSRWISQVASKLWDLLNSPLPMIEHIKGTSSFRVVVPKRERVLHTRHAQALTALADSLKYSFVVALTRSHFVAGIISSIGVWLYGLASPLITEVEDHEFDADCAPDPYRNAIMIKPREELKPRYKMIRSTYFGFYCEVEYLVYPQSNLLELFSPNIISTKGSPEEIASRCTSEIQNSAHIKHDKEFTALCATVLGQNVYQNAVRLAVMYHTNSLNVGNCSVDVYKAPFSCLDLLAPMMAVGMMLLPSLTYVMTAALSATQELDLASRLSPIRGSPSLMLQRLCSAFGIGETKSGGSSIGTPVNYPTASSRSETSSNSGISTSSSPVSSQLIPTSTKVSKPGSKSVIIKGL